MRILVQKSPRPRRWAGVATVAMLILALWCVKRPGELGAPSAQAAGPVSAQEGTSFLDNLQAPAAVHAAGNGLPAQDASDTHAAHGEALVASLASERGLGPEHGSALHAPVALGHSAGLPADTEHVAAPASHSAQRTGVAESSSRSTSGAMPTK